MALARTYRCKALGSCQAKVGLAKTVCRSGWRFEFLRWQYESRGDSAVVRVLGTVRCEECLKSLLISVKSRLQANENWP